MSLHELEQILNYTFNDRSLLQEALTHTTWLHEEQAKGRASDQQHQQRLEFLGDAFLGYAVGRRLFDRGDDLAPGRLTALRTALVRGSHLDALGQRLQLRRWIRLGAGESQNAQANKKVLEDTVEAIIGAVVVDGGEQAALDVVKRLLLTDEATEALVAVPLKDPVSEHNERWQARFKEPSPEPLVERIGGPDHRPVWAATYPTPDGTSFTGHGASSDEAKAAACAIALQHWS